MVMTITEKNAIVESAVFSELNQVAINLILCIEDLIYKTFDQLVANYVIEVRVFISVYYEYGLVHGFVHDSTGWTISLGPTLNAEEVAGVIATGIESFFENDAFKFAYDYFWDLLDTSGLMTQDANGRYQALPSTSQEFQDYWQLQLGIYDSSRATIEDNIEAWVNDVAFLDNGNYYIHFF